MKNYELDSKDMKTFILKYDVKKIGFEKKEIVIYFADNKITTIPYTIGNEKKILEKMKAQVENSTEFVKNTKQDCFINIVTPLIFIVFSLSMLFNGKIDSFLDLIYTIALCSSPIWILNNIITTKEKLNDLKKNQLFLENFDEITKEELDKNITINVSQNLKEIISSKQNDEKLTLNDIDGVKLKDVKIMVENLEREEEFDFDYSEPKTLTKAKHW